MSKIKITRIERAIPEDLQESWYETTTHSEWDGHTVRRLIERIGRVEQERDRLSRGGCGKPGHTTCSGEEGTCYCLTCELEGQLAKAKQDRDEANAKRRALRDQLIALYKSVWELEFKYTQPKEDGNGQEKKEG